MPYPDFSGLPAAYAGPEGSGGSPTPIPPPGNLTSPLGLARKRAIDNAAFIITSTGVCQLPNKNTTLGLFAQAQSCIIVCEAASADVDVTLPLIRMWMDGTAPTTVTGIPLYAGQPYELIGQDDMINVRFISTDGNQHAMQIQYFNGL